MKRRRKLLLTVVLVGTISIFVGLRLSLNRIVWSRIAAAFHDTYGIDVAIDKLSISLINGRATVRGLRVTDGETLVLAAEEVQLAASIRDIVGGSYEFETLVVTRPVFYLAVEKGESTNIVRIFNRGKQSDGDARVVFFQDARVIDGRFELEDAQTDRKHPVKLVFKDVEVSIHDLQVFGEPRNSELGDLRVDALLEQKHEPTRISLVGWAPPMGGKLTIALHAAITGLDLEQLPQYVTSNTRSALGGDVIHLVATMLTTDGAIKKGAIKAEVVATDMNIPMRFGGTTSDIVFDKDSKLSALFHLPFARLGHIGDVALTSTWGAARDVGSGFIDAGASVVDGFKGTLGSMVRFEQIDPLGALQAAGGGVIGGVEALGEGFIDGTKRVFHFGESKSKKAKKKAKQALEFTKLHERHRRAMLAAALASADDKQADRKRRIEHELEPAKPATIENEAK